ncbi:MAG: bi-domain-containing oxidoreductase [Bacteroidetes bacterium]|nr:bi-domain-containing oxidoreductase [Bacteroidota bacterium]
MKQIIQSFQTGNTELIDVPAPKVSAGSLLIKTTHSLVSLGTERMLVEFGKANLVSKARQQPDKVKQVMDKIKTDGLMPTLENVFKRLEQPLPLGYCNVGVVIAVGEGVSGFAVGDRVASNGKHAEYVNIPKNLCAKIPENVTQEEACFTVIGAIGLQGMRLCAPTFGETIVIIGLGLIGLLTAQMLLANGCKVIGIDLDEQKCEMARKWGVITVNTSKGDDPVKAVLENTDNYGADGVIITASAKSNDIISQAAQMSRKRGRIVLVGVIGLNLSRAEFFEKELTFQVSASYGPGRYDENYEQKGIDYPLPFVRWTEQRNFTAILNAISQGKLHVNDLVTEVIELDDYLKIYGEIGSSKSIASILKYPVKDNVNENPNTIKIGDAEFKGKKGVVGIIGAGNFTKMTMLPAMKESKANFKYIASQNGVNGTILAKKFNFSHSTTDYNEIINDPEVDTVMITTRHNTHAKFTVDALNAGKHVFVEKPLALDEKQLDEVLEAYSKQQTKTSLTVGFNRRFSPHIQAIKKALGGNPGPININATMNAGFIPDKVWVHDMAVGGGRIIGEACHYLDLCTYIAQSEIVSVCMNSMGEISKENTDNASILVKFKNGTNAVINYFANGSKEYSKERIEVFSHEKTYIMDNFRTTTAYGDKKFKNLKTAINKGHKIQFDQFIQRIQEGGKPLIPFNEIVNVTKASFAAIQSLKENRWVDVSE